MFGRTSHKQIANLAPRVVHQHHIGLYAYVPAPNLPTQGVMGMVFETWQGWPRETVWGNSTPAGVVPGARMTPQVYVQGPLAIRSGVGGLQFAQMINIGTSIPPGAQGNA